MLKKGLLILASASVIAACATAAWSSPTMDPNNSTRSPGLRLLVSDSANRLSTQKLEGADLRGKVAIFTNRRSHVHSVAFYLDDPKMQTQPRHIEYFWPFDFVGTATGDTAKLFDTSKLTAGRHVVTAKAVLTNGAKIVSSAAFYKKKVRTARTPTPTATQTAPQPQQTATAPPTTATQPVDLPSNRAALQRQPIQRLPSLLLRPRRPSPQRSPPRLLTRPRHRSPHRVRSPPADAALQRIRLAGQTDKADASPGQRTRVSPAGTNLTPYTGPCTITTPSTIIDSKIVNCDLEIKATGVIIRKSEIKGHVQSAREHWIFVQNRGLFCRCVSERPSGR